MQNIWKRWKYSPCAHGAGAGVIGASVISSSKFMQRFVYDFFIPVGTGGLAVARSRSGENDYQSFSNTLAPLSYLDCPQIELTRYGQIADKYIRQLNDFYEDLSV